MNSRWPNRGIRISTNVEPNFKRRLEAYLLELQKSNPTLTMARAVHILLDKGLDVESDLKYPEYPRGTVSVINRKF